MNSFYMLLTFDDFSKIGFTSYILNCSDYFEFGFYVSWCGRIILWLSPNYKEKRINKRPPVLLGLPDPTGFTFDVRCKATSVIFLHSDRFACGDVLNNMVYFYKLSTPFCFGLRSRWKGCQLFWDSMREDNSIYSSPMDSWLCKSNWKYWKL